MRRRRVEGEPERECEGKNDTFARTGYGQESIRRGDRGREILGEICKDRRKGDRENGK